MLHKGGIMLYRKFQDLYISALGFGLMRLPYLDDNRNQLNMTKVREMVHYAMEHGINYYDTAYNYHDGQSERVAGELLNEYPRDRFFLATKFPGFDRERFLRSQEIFQEQLDKCQVDFFDFYLMHSVSDNNIALYMDDELGLMDYLLKEKKAGRIRHLGFSTHASNDNLRLFLKKYHDAVEFCQIQINWIDWTYQNAKEKMEILNNYGIPVWVMEPLRGGYLASLAEDEETTLRTMRPDESIPAWSFRYLQQFPEIGVILSGMSTMTQLKENIETFSQFKPVSREENKALLTLAENKLAKMVVQCTACRYCVPECPLSLDIPVILETCNTYAFVKQISSVPRKLQQVGEAGDPRRCIACGSCESACPQNIPIAETISKFGAKWKLKD
jgi:predicted aldo/keto reductase-like oxidoreductase